jgi:hypothetical protein
MGPNPGQPSGAETSSTPVAAGMGRARLLRIHQHSAAAVRIDSGFGRYRQRVGRDAGKIFPKKMPLLKGIVAAGDFEMACKSVGSLVRAQTAP